MGWGGNYHKEGCRILFRYAIKLSKVGKILVVWSAPSERGISDKGGKNNLPSIYLSQYFLAAGGRIISLIP